MTDLHPSMVATEPAGPMTPARVRQMLCDLMTTELQPLLDRIWRLPACSEALLEVAAELERQYGPEGYSAQHDDKLGYQSLADAGACYLLGRTLFGGAYGEGVENIWPWEPESWKPKDDQHRTLVIAAALAIRALEVYDRAHPRPGVEDQIAAMLFGERGLEGLQP